jgi:hypothetical protein
MLTLELVLSSMFVMGFLSCFTAYIPVTEKFLF